MATDYKPIAEQVETQFVDLFYARYMDEQWGIDAGYAMIPEYIAVMQMELLTWQIGMDCTNELCAKSKLGTTTLVNGMSGTRPLEVENVCCNNNARFEPL